MVVSQLPKFCLTMLSCIGSIIGSVVDNYISTSLDLCEYLSPCRCLFIIPTFLAFVLPFLPETPRWLVAHGRHDDARQALKRLRPSTTDHQLLEPELHECLVIISLLWFVIDSKGKVYMCSLRWTKLLCYIFERIQSTKILSSWIYLFRKPGNLIYFQGL